MNLNMYYQTACQMSLLFQLCVCSFYRKSSWQWPSLAPLKFLAIYLWPLYSKVLCRWTINQFVLTKTSPSPSFPTYLNLALVMVFGFCSFSISTVTNKCKLNNLKLQNFYSYISLEARSLQSRHWKGYIPSERHWGNSFSGIGRGSCLEVLSLPDFVLFLENFYKPTMQWKNRLSAGLRETLQTSHSALSICP